jgi:hypothetical protein
MLFRKRIRVPRALIEDYRSALMSGINRAPEDERSLYEIHLSALNDLEKLLVSRARVEEIAIEIWRERRSYGWSYLSGTYGSLVEGQFHELATLIESQIFRIKGKDWYYSL